MDRLIQLITCVVLAGALTACPISPGEGGGQADGGDGGNATGGDGGADAGGSSGLLVGYCTERAAALCRFLVRCQFPEVAADGIEPQCRSQAEEQCLRTEAPLLGSALDDGRIVYDAEAARVCHEAFSERECAAIVAGIADEVCARIFLGTVPPGEECWVQQPGATDCASGYCDMSAARCPGTCKDFGAVGDGCADRNCDEAVAFCDETTEVCQALYDEGHECAWDYQCRHGLVCRASGPGPSPRKCLQRALPSTEGEPCSSDWDCATGLICSNDACVEQSAVGGPCDVTNKNRDCLDGNVCDYDRSTGMWRCVPPRSEGEGCVAPFACARGLWCNTMSGGICQSLPSVGEPCQTFCAGGAWCDRAASPHVCRPPGSAGDPCGGSGFAFTTCEPGLFCNNADVCEPRRASGEPCTANDDCQSGKCRSNGGLERFCVDVCLP